ncbi:MAG: hypothetical protein ACLFWD_03550 [Anaerolineales bacterium]
MGPRPRLPGEDLQPISKYQPAHAPYTVSARSLALTAFLRIEGTTLASTNKAPNSQRPGRPRRTCQPTTQNPPEPPAALRSGRPTPRKAAEPARWQVYGTYFQTNERIAEPKRRAQEGEQDRFLAVEEIHSEVSQRGCHEGWVSQQTHL